jgi:hypothetical protein
MVTFKQFLSEKLNSAIYHGTPSEKNAQSILKDKALKPGYNENAPRAAGNLTPMFGRTYFTLDLSYALIYALGMNAIGHQLDDDSLARLEKDGEYGYIFQGDTSKIKNYIADEDYVGEIARDVVSGDDTYNFTDDEVYDITRLIERAFDTVIMADEDDDTGDEYYDDPYTRFISHEMEFFAAVGKYILAKASPRIIVKFRKLTKHFSQSGDIPVIHAYKFKKSEANLINKDGSNFFQYAIKIF